MKKIEHQHAKESGSLLKKGCFGYLILTLGIPIALCALIIPIYLITLPFFIFKSAIQSFGEGKIIVGLVCVFISIAWTFGYYKLTVWLIKDQRYKAIFSQLTKGKFKPKTSKSNPEQISINGQTTIENPFAGIFVCGGAGSGKSKSLIEPIISDIGAKNYCGVIYDYKYPELAQYANTAYSNSLTKINFLNFTNLDESCRINPIAPEYMINTSFAREFAYTILVNINPQIAQKPDFWSDNSLTLLTAIFWYLRSEYPEYCTLPHAISLALSEDINRLLDLLKNNVECKDMVAPIVTGSKSDNQFAGVISSLQISLSKINTKEIYYLLTSNRVSLDLANPSKPQMLVIGNNPQLDTTYSPIISLILSSISKQLNRQGNEKSVFMLDEFPTVYVPNIERLPAVARSNKVATILACQDISQITDAYGREKTDTVVSNLGNQFYGRTTNPTTAQRVSQIYGKEDKMMQGTSSSTQGIGVFTSGRSKNYSAQERSLVKEQEVMQLPTGSFYTILSEGKQKQGLLSVSLRKFEKTPILPLNGYNSTSVANAYYEVKKDVEYILNKD